MLSGNGWSTRSCGWPKLVILRKLSGQLPILISTPVLVCVCCMYVCCMCTWLHFVCVQMCACVCEDECYTVQSLFFMSTVLRTILYFTFMSSKQSPSSKEASSSIPSTSSIVKVHFRLNTAAYMKIHFLHIPLIWCCNYPTCFLGNHQRNCTSSTENWSPRCDESLLLI